MATFAELAAEKDATIKRLEHQLQESLDKMDALFDRNWRPLLGGYGETAAGPSLTQVHEASERAREMTALNVHVKNGLKVRTSYVWRGGIHYSGIPGNKQGRGVNVQERIDNGINQLYFFSETAHEEREAALYCDSQAFYIGDESDWTIRPLPVAEITDDLRNPDQSDEIWAYRHSWTREISGRDPEPMVEWIFTNTFFDKKPASNRINYGGKLEPVAKDKRIFGQAVNSIAGWAYGVPDVLPAIKHAAQYESAMNAGMEVTQGLAKIIGTMKKNTQAGADRTAVTMGNANGGSGNLAAVGANNDMTMLSTAGNAYRFGDLLPVLANFAAGIGISVIELSANPGNAGGSYGAAKAMTPVTEAMTLSRRAFHIALDREVLLWLGAKRETLDVYFEPIIDRAEQYRATQMWGLRWGFGVYTPEEVKQALAEMDGQKHIKPVPAGVLLPNNEESLERKDIDTDGSAAANGGNMTPTQGSGANTVKSGSGDQNASDIRNRESALNMLEFMQREEFMDVMKELIDTMNAAKGE